MQSASQSYYHDFSQVDSWTSLKQGKEEMGQKQVKAIKRLKHIRGEKETFLLDLGKTSDFGS